MTTASLTELRIGPYEVYATQHADCGGNEAAALVYWRHHAVTQNLTFVARKGSVTMKPAEN